MPHSSILVSNVLENIGLKECQVLLCQTINPSGMFFHICLSGDRSVFVFGVKECNKTRSYLQVAMV